LIVQNNTRLSTCVACVIQTALQQTHYLLESVLVEMP